MRSFGRILFLVFFLLPLAGQSQDIVWNEAGRPPIRPPLELPSCRTLLAPHEIPQGSSSPSVNQSVGVVLAESIRVEDFSAQLDKLVAERGPEAVIGGRIYVTGVPMGKEKITRFQFEKALKARGFYDVKVTVMSIPTAKFKGFSLQTARAVLERVKYWFPSMDRDYQTPLRGEVTSGITSDILVEAPNLVFLFNSLDKTADFALTSGIHASLILAYNVWAKAITNWVLRPGGSKVAEFLKSAALSFPFVLNYAVFGHYSDIHNFYLQNGWEATLARFPAELANFGATQGLTTFLQVMFYRMVMVEGLGQWQNSKSGVEDSEIVRTVANVNRAPILVLDAIALFYASTNAWSLWHYGAFDLNAGHIALAALALAGKAAFWANPNFLDPTLHVGKWLVGLGRYFKSLAVVSEEENPPPPPTE